MANSLPKTTSLFWDGHSKQGAYKRQWVPSVPSPHKPAISMIRPTTHIHQLLLSAPHKSGHALLTLSQEASCNEVPTVLSFPLGHSLADRMSLLQAFIFSFWAHESHSQTISVYVREHRNSVMFLILSEVHWKFSSFTSSWTWFIKSGVVLDIHFHKSKEKYWHILQEIQLKFWNGSHSLVRAETKSDFRASSFCEVDKNPSLKSCRWEEQSWGNNVFSKFYFNS